jgi:LPS export ABC transporter protein LptC/lipopolysaccharide transport protein LptA
MSRWRRRARVLIAIFATVFALIVASRFTGRAPVPPATPVQRTDPGAVVESTGGTLQRFKSSHEDVSVASQKQLTYEDGSTKLVGVTIVRSQEGDGQSFTVTSNEGHAGQNESMMVLDGHVRLESSDGMIVRAEHATFTEGDKIVRAPGPVEFTHGRIKGAGVGLTYENTSDVLSILSGATVHAAPDEKGSGATDVTTGTAVYAKREKYIRFEKSARIIRDGQILEADSAVASLSADDKRIEALDLKENARMTIPKPAVGALQGLTGREMNLKYAADGQTLEHALISGGAVVQVAGEVGKPGRQIAASSLDVAIASDGSTPTAMVGRDAVELTMPPEATIPGRTIRSTNLDAKGEPGRGLTQALFSGNVQYRERGAGVDRAASSNSLEVSLKPGLSNIDDAKFSRAVRFEEGKMVAIAAAARYRPEPGILELSGSEPPARTPHVDNDQIAVDAPKIEVTLKGPKIQATGSVKSLLRPASDGSKPSKIPSMLKQDQPVLLLADTLEYDGAISKGTYTGQAGLFQGDTTIKGDTIVVDDKSGDLTASGHVSSTTVREQAATKDKPAERSHSTAVSNDFKYDDARRRLTYTGEAHMTGSEGDMSAATIELYLKSSGNELERVEAQQDLTLREQNRKTTGIHLTYTSADEKYIVTGAPATVVDECDRETTGKTLTLLKASDIVSVDGNRQTRTQTKGNGSKCQ